MAEGTQICALISVDAQRYALLRQLAAEDGRGDPADEVAWLIEKERAQRARSEMLRKLLDGEEEQA